MSNDWRKIEYKLPPENDTSSWWEDIKFGVGGWLLIFALIACVVGFVWSLWGALR